MKAKQTPHNPVQLNNKIVVFLAHNISYNLQHFNIQQDMNF